MVHAACEALGVPILTSERYEADDVIGTLAEKAAAAGFDVAIVTGDKDFFQLVRDGIRVYNPRDEGTWYDAAGVKEKFGVAPGSGRRRAGADGRHHRQHQRRARHRREGRARADRAPTDRSRTCSRTPPRCKHKRYREGAARATPTRRARAASWRGFAPTCRSSSTPRRCATAAASRERCFEIFNELGFRSLAKEYAPTADTIAKTYRIVNTADGRARAGRAAARRRTLRAARAARTARGDARGDRRPRVFDRAARRRLRADRPPRARRDREPAARRRRSTRCGRCSRTRRIEKVGPRSEVRRHRARAARRRRCAGSTSTRCSPATCSTRRDRSTRSRISRSSTPATRR